MKVVLLHYAAPPIVGGVESVIARHAHLMADAGEEVCIVAGRGEQTDPRIAFRSVPEVDSRNPEVLASKADLDAGRVPGGFKPLLQKIKGQLIPLVESADRVIAHNVCSLNKNLALTAALYELYEQSGRPGWILWHHDLAWTTPRYRPELHDGYPWDLLRTDWPGAAQVVVSEPRRRELAELLGVPQHRIHVIPNGIDVGEFLKLEPETQRIFEHLQLGEAAPLMLLPVRITPRKNIELALHVLAVLRRTLSNAMLLVTGPLGPHNPANMEYFERLRSLRRQLKLEEAAHFMAEVSEKTLPDAVIADLYRVADLLFFPSREEGFGIPILEAGLARMPIFCSDIPTLRALAGREAHYFSPDGNAGDIAGQITESLAADPAYHMRKRVFREFSWEQIYRNEIAPLLGKG